jgi:hypothetical protein
MSDTISQVGPGVAETRFTIPILAAITCLSTAVMLSLTSPEFSWDEAYRLPYMAHAWRSIWATYTVSHGPMSVYLGKLGLSALPASVPPEIAARLLIALIASFAVGLVYAGLRHVFRTSRAAALVGAGLLFFSVIRIQETNLIGPHQLMLACTLGLLLLGYRVLRQPTWGSAIGLGAILGFGVLSTPYIVPGAFCWVLAVTLTGREWVRLDRSGLALSWAFLLVFATAAAIAVLLWPAGVFRGAFAKDFLFYLHFSSHPTLVVDRMFEVTPRSAFGNWLVHLDAPILLASIAICGIGGYKTYRAGRLAPAHAYVAIFLAFFLATALAAHLAGARNLLQVIGVLCVATGVLFDEAIGPATSWRNIGAAFTLAIAALNLAWQSSPAGYVPYLATDGYQAFVSDNRERLREPSHAVVYGAPILEHYLEQSAAPSAWSITEMPWTTRSDRQIAPDVKYVLVPEFVIRYMPEDHPMRQTVSDHWKLDWSHEASHAWGLRLYERPDNPTQ